MVVLPATGSRYGSTQTPVLDYWSYPILQGTLDVPMQDVRLIIRFTRHWIHYGFMTHVAICAVVAAAEGLLGR